MTYFPWSPEVALLLHPAGARAGPVTAALFGSYYFSIWKVGISAEYRQYRGALSNKAQDFQVLVYRQYRGALSNKAQDFQVPGYRQYRGALSDKAQDFQVLMYRQYTGALYYKAQDFQVPGYRQYRGALSNKAQALSNNSLPEIAHMIMPLGLCFILGQILP